MNINLDSNRVMQHRNLLTKFLLRIEPAYDWTRMSFFFDTIVALGAMQKKFEQELRND